MHHFKNVMIFGVSGGLGNALLERILKIDSVERVYAGARSVFSHASPKVTPFLFDYDDEGKIKQVIEVAAMQRPLDLILVATGILKEGNSVVPERNLKELEWEKLLNYFHINSVGPMLVAKHAIPKLNNKKTSIFAAMSSRISCVSDNQMAGWYGYRASKAALNMMIKCAAIEAAQNNQKAAVIGLHPGGVDTAFSKPYQENAVQGGLFTPTYAAGKLMDVLGGVCANDSGRVLAWDGKEIEA
ncbi:Short-chain dehydrogenase/reductase SDR [Candidatus Terasakiella magnetica]|uniref:Short-chain dehydrogenase/reductase SDR n=1 Tax=Candidatus Terasakiella magnetica TaxID=1867952 RepID=A0A1C3REQ4_9PROT|nr:SDR family NAD(P)-dependent oxidoreductase [Candidatus Terasakiella magnetica]SCA55745.1 Short-chain dehydrogenase/reductase SDR [Candidatus Terasakiella magnetica]